MNVCLMKNANTCPNKQKHSSSQDHFLIVAKQLYRKHVETTTKNVVE